jgi:antitoxin MazE
MRTRIAKWGNSLALRLPKTLASDHGLGDGTAVELIEHEEGILLRPAGKRYDLKTLLKGVRADNLHRAEETGKAMGKEAW